MIITGGHWVIATVIAVAVHLAGVLWLSIASPDRQPQARDISGGIVVTLGREARSTAESLQAPKAETDVPAVAEPESEAPDAPVEAPQPESPVSEEPVPEALAAEPEPAARKAGAQDAASTVAPEPAAASPDAATPESVSPQTVESGRLDEAGSVDVESAGMPDAARPDAVAPVRDPTAAEQAGPAPEAARGSSPAPAKSVDVDEAASRIEPAATAEPRDTKTVEATETTVQPGEAAPTEYAHGAPVPEPSEPAAAVRDAPAAGADAAPAADTPPVDVAAPEPAGGRAAPVEDVETAPAEQSAPRVELGAVEPEVGIIAEPDLAAVRQPAPEVEQLRDPQAAETAAPETVKLQELQERSGGEGVVAHYAGVLKGWLQKNMHYPRAARLSGQEGDVVVRFVIDRQGNVLAVELESGSGHRLLDREATEMVERGDPFPAMPEDMPGERLEVRVPVSFHVRDATRTKDLPPIYLE